MQLAQIVQTGYSNYTALRYVSNAKAGTKNKRKRGYYLLSLLCFGTISTDTCLAKLNKCKTPQTRGFLFGNGQGTPTVGEQTAWACNSPQRIATQLDSHQPTNCTKARRMACYTPAALHSIMRTLKIKRISKRLLLWPVITRSL